MSTEIEANRKAGLFVIIVFMVVLSFFMVQVRGCAKDWMKIYAVSQSQQPAQAKKALEGM